MVTDIDAGREIGVSRNTIAEWKKRPEFQEEYKRRLKDKWESAELMAIEMMQKLAREGDFKAVKYILDSLDYAPAQKIEADVSSHIVINIGDDDDDVDQIGEDDGND